MSRPGRPGIGHNLGPALQSSSWKAYCWRHARKALVGERMPVEVVRRRIDRARQIGLTYPQYASILLGTGRDVTAFLFTVDGLQLRLLRRLEMPLPVQDKLQALRNCSLLSFAPREEPAEPFRVELEEVAGVPFAAAAAQPGQSASWSEARRAVRSVLDPLKLPGNAVVMVGHREHEEKWSSAGELAYFLSTQTYFDSTAS